MEERMQKKKAKLEDFGGVHNAPSSFFEDSIDEWMFSDKFVDEINNMSELSHNSTSIDRLVTLKDSYSAPKKSAVLT